MTKLRSPLFSFIARGSLADRLSFKRKKKQNIVEAIPTHADPKTPGQTAHRTMFQACTALWHTLSAAEKQSWDSQASKYHMPGYSYFMSLCLKPNPGIYLPLAGGTMSGNIDMATNRILNLPAPVANEEPLRKMDAAGGSKIQDADGDTSWDTEQSADEDKVRGRVKGVEAFLLEDDGILTTVKQSGAAGYQTTDQAFANMTEIKVSWHAEEYDIQGESNLATGTFTAKKAGIYFCMCQVQIKYPASGKWGLVSIWKNGTRIKFAALFSPPGADSHVTSIATFVKLAATDYIQFYYKHNFGYTVYTNGKQERCYFGIAKVA